MRHVIRVITHMIVSGTCMLFFAKAFESSWELAVYSLITMLLVAFLYGLRCKAESFWVFLGSHVVLLLGGIFLIPVFGAYKWYIVIWCFWIVYSAVLRLVPVAEYLDEPGVTYVVVLVIEYFGICFLEGSMEVRRLSLLGTALVFLLYMFYRNLESMDEFILMGSFSNKIDEQGIRKLNRRLSLLYIGMLGAFLATFSLFRLDGLRHTILGWLRSFVRFLVCLLPISEEMRPKEEEEIEQGMSNLLQETIPEHELSEWRLLLQEIFRDIMTFLMVAIIIAGIIYAVSYVYRHFYKNKNREDGDRVIEALSFGAEITKEKKPRFFERFERSPVRRIRRIYKKSLKRAGAKHMPNLRYMSPDEQVQYLRKQGMSEEAIDEMKWLYEKARYSSELVTESEAERMRAIL